MTGQLLAASSSASSVSSSDVSSIIALASSSSVHALGAMATHVAAPIQSDRSMRMVQFLIFLVTFGSESSIPSCEISTVAFYAVKISISFHSTNLTISPRSSIFQQRTKACRNSTTWHIIFYSRFFVTLLMITSRTSLVQASVSYRAHLVYQKA